MVVFRQERKRVVKDIQSLKYQYVVATDLAAKLLILKVLVMSLTHIT